MRLPDVNGLPAYGESKSLSSMGTPDRGPLGNGPCAARRASSSNRQTTALSVGFSRSMEAMTDSTNSSGETSRA
jgi:hypothetical protein